MKPHNLTDNQENLKVKSRKQAQLYCASCKNTFCVRRGTMFYDLRTPLDKIVSCLSLLASGTGMNAVSRATGVTGDSLRAWTVLASLHVAAFTDHLQGNMHLEQVQVDEFWAYIRKKKKI